MHTLYTNQIRETSLKILKNTRQGRQLWHAVKFLRNLENEEDNREKFSFKDSRERAREEYPRAFFPLNVWRYRVEIVKCCLDRRLFVEYFSFMWTEHIFSFPDPFAFEGGAGHMSRQGGALKIAMIKQCICILCLYLILAKEFVSRLNLAESRQTPNQCDKCNLWRQFFYVILSWFQTEICQGAASMVVLHIDRQWKMWKCPGNLAWAAASIAHWSGVIRRENDQSQCGNVQSQCAIHQTSKHCTGNWTKLHLKNMSKCSK